MGQKFTFVGCSFTVGVGLELEKSDPQLYTNIVANNFSADIIHNVAVGGNSNYNIFITALIEMLFNTPDKLFVQWSALNRLWLYPGPNTELFLAHTITSDYNYRDKSYPKKQLQEFANTYHILNHDYKNLLTLIDYCNILTKINNCQIIFINGLLPWTQEILTKITTENLAKNLSTYSKEVLDFDTRDDSELIELFTILNTAVLSLDQLHWVNMFNSMVSTRVDLGNDRSHPGPKSHQLYAEMIINYLNKNYD
jgi:hypothetical protein